jgi:hypothetical protein
VMRLMRIQTPNSNNNVCVETKQFSALQLTKIIVFLTRMHLMQRKSLSPKPVLNSIYLDTQITSVSSLRLSFANEIEIRKIGVGTNVSTRNRSIEVLDLRTLLRVITLIYQDD